jgi:hypothetical protein
MTTIYDTDDGGNIIVVFDSRWRFPETLGFSSDDPEYGQLQRLWESATGRTIENDKPPTVEMKEDDVNGSTGKRQRKNK